MSELGGQRRGRRGESRATALGGRASVWRLQGLGRAAASQPGLGEGQPGPPHLFLTPWLDTHPNRFIILPLVLTQQREKRTQSHLRSITLGCLIHLWPSWGGKGT